MSHDPERYHRRSIRLPGYDYTTPGAYFVTLCVHDGACVLGGVVDGEVTLTEEGRIVTACWVDLPNHYPHVRMDAFVVMPNHVHGIIVLVDGGLVGTGGIEARCVGAGGVGAGFEGSDSAAGTGPRSDGVAPRARGVKPAPTGATTGATPTRHPLPEIVRALKTFSARRINALRGTRGQPFWQRSYYEHIVRNQRELDAIRAYIVQNPLRWDLDREHPDCSRSSAVV